MNEQSLKESNALLAAASSRTAVGELIPGSPAELAQESGIETRLSVARAVRALMARGRIAQEGSRYRLLDDRPVEQGEQASVRRPIRRRRGRAERAPEPAEDGPPTYEQLGRTLIERLIELSAEAAELRAALERARGEAEAARREAVEVRREAAAARREAVEVRREAAADRRRAEGLEDEATALRKRLEMTESNLRTVVEAAKSRPASPLEDTDARAILDILSRKDT